MNTLTVIGGSNIHKLFEAYWPIAQQVVDMGYKGVWRAYGTAGAKSGRLEADTFNGISLPGKMGEIRTASLVEALDEVRAGMPGGSMLPTGFYFETKREEYTLNMIYSADGVQTFKVTSHYNHNLTVGAQCKIIPRNMS